MARFLQFDSITQWWQIALLLLCPISEHRGQHAHHKEFVIKQERHLWNSWHFITCQKCWRTDLLQGKDSNGGALVSSLLPEENRLKNGVLSSFFRCRPQTNGCPIALKAHNCSASQCISLLIFYVLFETFSFPIQHFQMHMPEVRHLNLYLWCLQKAAGYSKEQANYKANIIKIHKHLQKKTPRTRKCLPKRDTFATLGL